jgi:hypothetical protein
VIQNSRIGSPHSYVLFRAVRTAPVPRAHMLVSGPTRHGGYTGSAHLRFFFLDLELLEVFRGNEHSDRLGFFSSLKLHHTGPKKIVDISTGGHRRT